MNAFLSQGGYAFFIWGAYGMTFALLIAESISLVFGHYRTLHRLRRWIRGRDPLSQ